MPVGRQVGSVVEGARSTAVMPSRYGWGLPFRPSTNCWMSAWTCAAVWVLIVTLFGVLYALTENESTAPFVYAIF